MQNEMNLMRQMVEVLVESATHKKDYGRELETLDWNSPLKVAHPPGYVYPY